DVLGVAADLATDEGTATVLDAVPHVDVLVNNLGIFSSEDPLAIDDATWRRYFEVNVLAGVRLTRAYLPGMVDRGWGRVQFVGSDSAVVIPAEMIHYGVTKTALLGVSRGFAKAAAGTGVTVNSVLAGPTHTGGVEAFARGVACLASPLASAARGGAVRVVGGSIGSIVPGEPAGSTRRGPEHRAPRLRSTPCQDDASWARAPVVPAPSGGSDELDLR